MEIKVQQPIAPQPDVSSALSKGSGEAAIRSRAVSANLPDSSSAASVDAASRSRQAREQDLQKVVEELQRRVQSTASNLHFSIDQETGRTVVKVTDANTQEVIRQIPAEEILRLDKALERMQGLLLNKRG